MRVGEVQHCRGIALHEFGPEAFERSGKELRTQVGPGTQRDEFEHRLLLVNRAT
jgi:hypothetical protein